MATIPMVMIFIQFSFVWLFCLIGDFRIAFLDDGKVTWREFFTSISCGQPSRLDVKRKQTQSFTLMERSRERQAHRFRAGPGDGET